MKVRLAAGLGLGLVSRISLAQAQEDCGCDHVVAPDVPTISGAELGVGAGEVVCIEAGAREFLRIYDMVGTAEAPIVIKNCGGQVVIDNADRGYGLTLDGSAFVRITGTGDAATPYGFSVRASRTGPDYSASCIALGGMSTDYEVDHIEAYDCGFAGVTAKTDPNCENRDLSAFVQRNSRLHHLYLHDTGGEGIYFGSTGYPSRAGTCDGVEVDLIPHSHEGVWIHDNIIEDTGWDGAQVGVSPADCYVYRNRIARVGLAGEEFQMQGLQFGGGSSCEVFDNFIAHGPAIGVIVLDAGDMLIANNVFYDFVDGIYINDRDSPIAAGATYHVVHNTVVQTSDRGITLFGALSVNNLVLNNLIVDGGNSPLGFAVDGRQEGNLILDAVGEASFVDAGAEDFMLEEDSPAVDAGVDASETGVTMDQRSAPRDASPDAGAFEFGAVPPDEPYEPPGGSSLGGGPGGPPVPIGGPGDGPSEEGASGDDGGCSCRSVGAGSNGAPFGAWVPGLLLLIGLVRRSRRLEARVQGVRS